MSEIKTDYRSLLTARPLLIKTPERVLELLKKENPGIEIPNFSSFLFTDKHTVPKKAQIVNDKIYMGKLYDLHFVKKGVNNHVLYFVKK